MKHTQSKRMKVENHPNLKRDVRTTAIVNTDHAAYERYMNDKNARLSQRDEIDRLKERVSKIENLLKNTCTKVTICHCYTIQSFLIAVLDRLLLKMTKRQ